MKNISDDVLAKYMLGEASGAEQNQVENWLGQSDGNKKYYDNFRLIWNESRNLTIATNVNEDIAWERFKERTEQYHVPRSKSFAWLKIAAIFVLFAGGGWLSYNALQNQDIKTSAKIDVPLNALPNKTLAAPHENNISADPALNAKEIIENTESHVDKDIIKEKHETKIGGEISSKSLALHNNLHLKKGSNMNGLYSYYKKKDVVCNGTACPIEICIIQSAKCKNREDSKISTCNTLEPDESGQLHYKTYDKTLANCILTIEEIRITRLSTGETIVLNDSTPVKAQDLFDYMTGKKKGDIVAGMFHTDCNNYNHSHDLTFDNKLGDLLLK